MVERMHILFSMFSPTASLLMTPLSRLSGSSRIRWKRMSSTGATCRIMLHADALYLVLIRPSSAFSVKLASELAAQDF
jgi:hypothetical protein